MRFEIFRDAAGEYRWRLVAGNGEKVADSGEGYTRERDVRRAIKSLRLTIWMAPVVARGSSLPS